jgi:hypothetical protein
MDPVFICYVVLDNCLYSFAATEEETGPWLIPEVKSTWDWCPKKKEVSYIMINV